MYRFSMFCFLVFFFFKQKTAYEVRISDWSSDVCSSDLRARLRHRRGAGEERGVVGAHDAARIIIDAEEIEALAGERQILRRPILPRLAVHRGEFGRGAAVDRGIALLAVPIRLPQALGGRSAGRRGGKEWVR